MIFLIITEQLCHYLINYVFGIVGSNKHECAIRTIDVIFIQNLTISRYAGFISVANEWVVPYNYLVNTTQ